MPRKSLDPPQSGRDEGRYSVCVVAAMSCACTFTTRPEPARVTGMTVVGPLLAGTELTVATIVHASAALIGLPSRVLGPALVAMGILFSFAKVKGLPMRESLGCY